MALLMHNQVNRVGVAAMLIGVVCLVAVLNMDGSEADYEASDKLNGMREWTHYTAKNVKDAQHTAGVAGKAEKAEKVAASAADVAVDRLSTSPGVKPPKPPPFKKLAKKARKVAPSKAPEPPVKAKSKAKVV